MNVLFLQNEYFMKIILKRILLTVFIIIYAFISYSFIDLLYSLEGAKTFGLIFIILSIVLFLVCVSVFIFSALHEKFSMCLGMLICILPFSSKIPIKYIVYIDNAGRNNFFTLVCFLIVLLVTFIVLNTKLKYQDIFVNFRTNKGLCLALFGLFTSCLVTQVINLGLISGLSIVLLRIGIPSIFFFCTLLSIKNYKDLYVIFGCIIVSMLIAILMSNIGTTIKLSDSGLAGMLVKRAQVEGFASWTMFGTLLSLTLPLCMFFYLDSGKILIKIFMISIFSIFMYEIIITHTRGSIISSITLLTILLHNKTKKYYNTNSFWCYLLITILTAGPIVYQEIFMRAWASDMLYDTSVNARFERILSAIEYIKHNPIIGIGFGKPQGVYSEEIAYYIYNGYLSWWVFSGLFGMLFFLYIHYKATQVCFSHTLSLDKNEFLVGITMLLIMIGWLINQMITADQLTYFHSVESVCYFYIHIGIACSIRNIIYNEHIVKC